jgi:hypothetical protein
MYDVVVRYGDKIIADAEHNLLVVSIMNFSTKRPDFLTRAVTQFDNAITVPSVLPGKAKRPVQSRRRNIQRPRSFKQRPLLDVTFDRPADGCKFIRAYSRFGVDEKLDSHSAALPSKHKFYQPRSGLFDKAGKVFRYVFFVLLHNKKMRVSPTSLETF